MKRAIIVLLAIGSAARAQSLPPLSPEARASLDAWHLSNACEVYLAPIPPGALTPFGVRRIPDNVIKWRVKPGASQLLAPARNVVNTKVAPWLAPWVSFQEVASGDTTAQLSFRVGNTITDQTGITRTLAGCGVDVRYASLETPNVITTIEVVCRSGVGGVTVMTHELWWHGLFTPYCHRSASNSCGGASANQLPPADGNCLPGESEGVRWMYQVAPGTLLP